MAYTVDELKKMLETAEATEKAKTPDPPNPANPFTAPLSPLDPAPTTSTDSTRIVNNIEGTSTVEPVSQATDVTSEPGGTSTVEPVSQATDVTSEPEVMPIDTKPMQVAGAAPLHEPESDVKPVDVPSQVTPLVTSKSITDEDIDWSAIEPGFKRAVMDGLVTLKDQAAHIVKLFEDHGMVPALPESDTVEGSTDKS